MVLARIYFEHGGYSEAFCICLSKVGYCTARCVASISEGCISSGDAFLNELFLYMHGMSFSMLWSHVGYSDIKWKIISR